MTICADAQLLAEAARALAARPELVPVLECFSDRPLNPCTVDELRSWLDGSHPRAAAALDRLRASDAAAPHHPAPRCPHPRSRHTAGPVWSIRPDGPVQSVRPNRPDRPGRQR